MCVRPHNTTSCVPERVTLATWGYSSGPLYSIVALARHSEKDRGLNTHAHTYTVYAYFVNRNHSSRYISYSISSGERTPRGGGSYVSGQIDMFGTVGEQLVTVKPLHEVEKVTSGLLFVSLTTFQQNSSSKERGGSSERLEKEMPDPPCTCQGLEIGH